MAQHLLGLLELLVVVFLSFKKSSVGLLEFDPFWFINLVKLLKLDLFEFELLFGTFDWFLVVGYKVEVLKVNLVQVVSSLGFLIQVRPQLTDVSFLSFDAPVGLVDLSLVLLLDDFQIDDFFSEVLNLNLFLFVFVNGSFQVAVFFDEFAETFLLSFDHLFDLLFVLTCALEVSQGLHRRIMVLLEVLELFKELSFLFDFLLNNFRNSLLGNVLIKKLIEIPFDLRVSCQKVQFQLVNLFKSFDLIDLILRLIFDTLTIGNNGLKFIELLGILDNLLINLIDLIFNVLVFPVFLIDLIFGRFFLFNLKFQLIDLFV